jgi:hypothetical protein
MCPFRAPMADVAVSPQRIPAVAEKVVWEVVVVSFYALCTGLAFLVTSTSPAFRVAA